MQSGNERRPIGPQPDGTIRYYAVTGDALGRAVMLYVTSRNQTTVNSERTGEVFPWKAGMKETGIRNHPAPAI